MQVLSRSGGWLGLFVLAIIAGCGQGAGEGTSPVSGTVTQKGSPVEGAIVSFVPASEGGENAVGVTDAAGKYILTTRKKDDGALPGQYKVSITKYDKPKETAATSAPLPEGELSSPDYKGEAPETPPAKNLLPSKYASSDTSGLSATVNSGPNTHNFELEP